MAHGGTRADHGCDPNGLDEFDRRDGGASSTANSNCRGTVHCLRAGSTCSRDSGCYDRSEGERPMNPIPSTDYFRILPEIILVLFGIIVMMIDPLLDDHNDRRSLGVVSVV